MEFKESQSNISEWAKQFAEGDARAAEKLFDYFYPLIFRYIKSRMKDSEVAEDLAQDVFVKVARSIRLYDVEKGRFTAWIWQITKNIIIDHIRAKARHHEDAASTYELELDTFADSGAFEADSELQKVMTIISKYPEEDQELFRMRYLADMPYKEIADMTDRTVNAVTVACHRIREKVKKELYEQSI